MALKPCLHPKGPETSVGRPVPKPAVGSLVCESHAMVQVSSGLWGISSGGTSGVGPLRWNERSREGPESNWFVWILFVLLFFLPDASVAFGVSSFCGVGFAGFCDFGLVWLVWLLAFWWLVWLWGGLFFDGLLLVLVDFVGF